MFGSKFFKRKQYDLRRPKWSYSIGAVRTECGNATSDSGPFYCPRSKVYMDYFWRAKTRFGAQGGEFATAYVITHEIGHHVQTLLGTSSKMRHATRKIKSWG
jgi:predicted metalloprotease